MMMLKQKIDAAKLLLALHELNRADDSARHSILDALILLLINEHPECSKRDLTRASEI